MSTKVTSARGQEVDFDLMRIKQQIGSAPKTVDVKTREQFVDLRLRRRARVSSAKLPQAIEEIQAAEEVKSMEVVDSTTTEKDTKKPTRTKVDLKDDIESTEE